MSPVEVFSGVLYCCFGCFVVCGFVSESWVCCDILFVVGGFPGLLCGCWVGFCSFGLWWFGGLTWVCGCV